MQLKEYSDYVKKRVDAFLQSKIESLDNSIPLLKEILSYGLLLGGKRSRPLLVYATGSMFNVPLERLDYIAAAIECIHAYSLIHDDMPEMDNDTYRRGHITVHKKYGQNMALLAGDTLQSLAFELLSSNEYSLASEHKIKLVNILAKASGYSGMCGGQALDLLSENKHISLDELKLLHSKKTGALIESAVLLGAYAYENIDDSHIIRLSNYAKLVGLAFQVWDDVLDVVGDSSKTGKAVGADVLLGKSTYPALMGVQEAKDYALELAAKAINEIQTMDKDCSLLIDFANFVVSRDH